MEKSIAEREILHLLDYLQSSHGGLQSGETVVEAVIRVLNEARSPACPPEPSPSSMARALMQAYLSRHVWDFARQIYEIEYPMAPEHFIAAILRLAYEAGQFPQAPFGMDPDWGGVGRADPGRFVCAGCGEEKQAARVGQRYCNNACASRAVVQA